MGLTQKRNILYNLSVMCFGIPCGPKTFLFMKEFKTTEEQIELLKNRGLTFENEGNAKEILLNNTYYNIINGYKELFITPEPQIISLLVLVLKKYMPYIILIKN